MNLFYGFYTNLDISKGGKNMYEQQLYTRSNYGGIFENRPGFTTVGATSGLDTKDIEALEQHCEYPVSKIFYEGCK